LKIRFFRGDHFPGSLVLDPELGAVTRYIAPSILDVSREDAKQRREDKDREGFDPF
jgi:hypothetical protein